MPGQIQKSRISGLFEDTAMSAGYEEDWTEKEEVLAVVRGALAGGSAFRTLKKSCRNLTEIMQAAEDRYLQVYAGEFEKYNKAGDMKIWHGHLEGRWRL